MDEMDLTAAESKATYEEIKANVKEKTGLKVSNLYIAQIKQKCGIIERENYNKPKVEDEMVSKCPVDKEKQLWMRWSILGEIQKYYKDGIFFKCQLPIIKIIRKLNEG